MKTTSQEGHSKKLEQILVCHESRPGCRKMTKNVKAGRGGRGEEEQQQEDGVEGGTLSFLIPGNLVY